MIGEEWRSVVGHPAYEVSNLGRVRSWKKLGRGPRVRYLSPSAEAGASAKRASGGDFGGPQAVRTTPSSLRRSSGLGRMACGWPTGMDFPPTTRRRTFRYATPQENSNDRYEHGTMLAGSDVPSSKLTSEQVTEIRAEYGPHARYRRGQVTQRYLAEKYGVTPHNIQMILSGQKWVSRAGYPVQLRYTSD